MSTTTLEAKLRLRPRRTLNQLAFASVGLGLGIMGQYFLNQDTLNLGLSCFFIAVLIFSRGLFQSYTLPAYSYKLPLPQDWRARLGPSIIVVALSASFLAYRLFADVSTQQNAWWVYLASLFLLILGVMVLSPSGAWGAEFRRLFPSRQVVLGLGGILLLALFMRLFNFNQQPFGIWYDEAQAGLEARQMIANPSYRPIFYSPINISGHLLALYALALHYLSDTIQGMRMVSVAFGVGGVVAAYLLGRELYGPRFGLAMAFFLAVMRWHVNFSRIAMTGVDTPFFELLSLFFLTRLLRWGRPRDALGAGLVLGFGLTFYTAFRLYLVALVIFALLAMLGWRKNFGQSLKENGWQVYLVNLAVLLVSLSLVIMPLIRFAQDNPDEFWYRIRQTSILTKRDQADLRLAIETTAEKHLLMFNYQGDNNGRHNLPGSPMLDFGMGVLFVLGLGLAVVHINRPINLFFLILFPVALSGGILSLDFEAPQSLRSIGVIPAILYFCSLAVMRLGQEAEKSLKPLPPIWTTAPALMAAGFIFYTNATTYLITQAQDFASWNAFSTPETLTGLKMAELGPDNLYLSSPFLTNHPSINFLAPQAQHQQRLTLPDALPVREAPTRPVALFIHPDDAWIFAQAQALYPQGHFETFTQIPGEGAPVVHFAQLQPSDIAAIQGLELRYLPIDETLPIDPTLFPIQPTRALNVAATWPNDLPPTLQNLPVPFQAEWQGVLYVPQYGQHSFRFITPAQGELEIDGNIVLAGTGQQTTGLPLAQGHHALVIRATAAPGEVALYWQPPAQPEAIIPQWNLYSAPVSYHGLLGVYYQNDSWQGQPVMQRIDPFLDTYFHFTPLPRPYSVEWRGSLIAPQNGLYQLGLRAVPEAQLQLDGQPLLTTAAPDQMFQTGLMLEAGLHELVIRFKDNVDRSRIHLYWTPPSGTFMPIPSENLWPPLGKYPQPTQPAVTEPTLPLMLDWVASFGGPGTEPGRFVEPRDISLLQNGNMVVADTINQRVQILDPNGQPLFALNGDAYPFEEPLAVAVNGQGQILVLESAQQWIYRYDATGQFIDRFGGPEAHLFHPRGLNVLSDDTVVVADTGGARFALFNADGTPTGSLGGLGQGPGQFNEPTDVLRDPYGIYYVAEAENKRIQRVDMNGLPLGQWVIPSSYAFDGPHLAFAPDGSLFVTDAQNGSLLRYSPTGNMLNQWTTIGPVKFFKPVGIYFNEVSSRLYVTDITTHQIHVFLVHLEK